MKTNRFAGIAMAFTMVAFMISCQSNSKDSAQDGADSTVVDSNGDTTHVGSSATSVSAVASPSAKGASLINVKPEEKVVLSKFSNAEVNTIFSQFEAIKEEYLVALKEKNAEKIKEANEKYQKWVLTASSLTDKVGAQENQRYIDQYTKLVSQWDNATRLYKK